MRRATRLLLSWRNAREEAKRLREYAALGKPVTEGQTPQIRRRKRAIFEGIF